MANSSIAIHAWTSRSRPRPTVGTIRGGCGTMMAPAIGINIPPFSFMHPQFSTERGLLQGRTALRLIAPTSSIRKGPGLLPALSYHLMLHESIVYLSELVNVNMTVK